ncbi:hypothetical protein BIFADO_02346 [Bifidobacterium adolescentis L2-32]|uniref:Uncharacterized protein n=1 Tax=Bifidobacterium adolescentis L2-32 TaxID=411481 RepID=A7A903_BIFAD|nr:hypothetical protein BIFADO_02346 [Bifidobacterium adolescentis L2-32]
MANVLSDEACRSPYGERGLKWLQAGYQKRWHRSLSLRRAWIEMFVDEWGELKQKVALLTESVD